MKFFFRLTAVFAFIFSLQTAEARQQENGTDARLLRLSLASAPFPDSSRAEGHTYEGQFYPADKHYADSSVLVFIPSDFLPKNSLDIVVHFHGWRNSADSVLLNFELARQLDNSEKNAILVVPQMAFYAPDSNGGKLMRKGNFSAFMIEVLSALHRSAGFVISRVDNIILSAHSGGYRTVSQIIKNKDLESLISEIYLFDGLYAEEQTFLDWAKADKNRRFINIYTDSGGTDVLSKQTAVLAEQQEISDRINAEDDLIRLEDLEKNNFFTIHSNLDHNKVQYTSGAFYRFLITSPNLRKK